jgi:hypothetical protein
MRAIASQQLENMQWPNLDPANIWLFLQLQATEHRRPLKDNRRSLDNAPGRWSRRTSQRILYRPPFVACFLLILSDVFCNAVLMSPLLNVARS